MNINDMLIVSVQPVIAIRERSPVSVQSPVTPDSTDDTDNQSDAGHINALDQILETLNILDEVRDDLIEYSRNSDKQVSVMTFFKDVMTSYDDMSFDEVANKQDKFSEFLQNYPNITIRDDVSSVFDKHNIIFREEYPTDGSRSSNNSDTLGRGKRSATPDSRVTLYQSFSGKWSTNVFDVITSYGWIARSSVNSLGDESPHGYYFLASSSTGVYQWLEGGAQRKIKCATERGLIFNRNELLEITRELSNVIKFFDQAQEPTPSNDTTLDAEFYACRSSIKTLPRIIQLAVNDALTELRMNKATCDAKLAEIYDIAELLCKDPKYKDKHIGDRVKPHKERSKRSGRSRRSSNWDFIGPEDDYQPLIEVLDYMKNNLMVNHIQLKKHAVRVKSLENIIDQGENINRMLGALHNIDVLSRDIEKSSSQNLENLQSVNIKMKYVVEDLRSVTLLLANSVHFDASCYAQPKHMVSCAKDVPRVNFTSAGYLTIEYYTEKIRLEAKQYFTCLPIEKGLSRKHHHYAIQSSGSSILLNNGVLIMNSTDDNSFTRDYGRSIATIEQCYFNTRLGPAPHIYLNCRIDTQVQYHDNRGRLATKDLKAFGLLRIDFSQFPITIRSQTLSLDDILKRQKSSMYENMYARVSRGAWYSALYLPRALLEHKEHEEADAYWTDVANLAYKYPKMKWYFAISVSVMTLTALGIVGGCCVKYRINILNCFVGLYDCCQPQRTEQLSRPQILRFRKRRQNENDDTVTTEEVRPIIREKSRSGKKSRREDSSARSRSRTRSRSRSPRSPARRRARATSRSPPPYGDTNTEVMTRALTDGKSNKINKATFVRTRSDK